MTRKSLGLDPRLVSSFRRASQVCSAGVIALGLLVLAGWTFAIPALKTVRPSFATMKANTAFLFVVLGISLWSAPRNSSTRMRRACALVVILIAALTEAEYVFHLDLGVDQVLFRDTASGALAPGRMAPATTVNFLLLGLALFFLDVGTRRRPSDVAATLAATIAFLSFCGYAYGATSLYKIGPYVSIAFHTTLGFLAASLAFFIARPGEGLTSVLASDTAAGSLLRRILPAIVVVPLVLGWLRLRGQDAGLYDTTFGVAILIAANIGLPATAVSVIAASLHVSELKRRQAEQLVAASGRELAITLHSIGDAITATDLAGNVVRMNAVAELLTGWNLTDALSKPFPDVFRIVDKDTGSPVESPVARVVREGDIVGLARRTVVVSRDGSEHPIAVTGAPIRDGNEEIRGVVLVFRDVGPERAAEHQREDLMGQLKTLNADLEERVRGRTSELMASLRERDILLQEVHHRVKNNLQVISSLISRQMRKLGEPGSRDALEGCQSRVQAIALIHEKLYQSEDYSRVPSSEYARSLASNVFHAAGVSPTSVTLDLAIEDLALAVDRAIPCGLVLNELITNALKHAFKDGRQGTVRVELANLDAGRLRLAVKDNGVGLPRGLDIRNSESLGLQLVCTLSEQLDAELEVNGRNGASFQLTFSAAG